LDGIGLLEVGIHKRLLFFVGDVYLLKLGIVALFQYYLLHALTPEEPDSYYKENRVFMTAGI
jgi:hypothetical protein